MDGTGGWQALGSSGGGEAVVGEDGLGFRRAEEGQESLGELGVWGVAEDGGGVVRCDLEVGRGFDDLETAVGGEDVGAVDKTGVGFAEFQLGGHLADVGLEGDDVLEDSVGETWLLRVGGVEGKHLAGVGASGDGLGGHDDAAAGLCEGGNAAHAGGVAGRYRQHEGIGSHDGWARAQQSRALEGVEVVGVG